MVVRREIDLVIGRLLCAFCFVGCSSASTSATADSGAASGPEGSVADGGHPTVLPVALPGGDAGIGFDDMKLGPSLKKVIVPAGRTGDVDLVDPVTNAVTRLGGFSTSPTFTLGKHRSGSTSADEGNGSVFAVDNETQTVRVVDPVARSMRSSTMLAGPPDYIRWVESTGELWITMPNNPGVTQSANPGIEVLTVADGGSIAHAASIPVSGGPESLAIDNSRRRVYTNASFTSTTYSIDMVQRTIVETWSNGCAGLTVGLALDESRGFLIVACSGGSVAVLDVAHGGAMLGTVTASSGLDIISYNPSLHHAYLAGATTGDMSIVGVSAMGLPTVLGKVATAVGSQQVAADDDGNAWVGDPAGGRLLKVHDTYPPTQ